VALYRELGWGGWWFWDPVENASLLPWLSATALLHSLIVSEKRNSFKGWTLLLAIVTFTLSLLGTFLVRSGVLVSVHAFASDPTRGIFLLGYLALIIGGAFLLYSLRIQRFYQAPNFQLLSRETFLLINSVVLLAAVFTIVIGTLYPIILDALDFGKISVGEPYFNTVFIPIILPTLLLMGFAPHVHWKQQSITTLWKKLYLTIIVSFLLGFFGPLLFGFEFYWLTAFGISFALWIILATIQYTYQLKRIELQHYAMIVAHIGIAILALGVIVNKSYSAERQVKILPGDSVELSGYQFTFVNVDEIHGPNYQSITATFDVQKNNGAAEKLFAEQRIYKSNQETLSKPGILVNPWRDLYLALGNSFADGGWSIRVYYKPLVRWIWFGGFLLLLGGLLSLIAYWKKRGTEHDSV
jgi:cytochrome c-type biogenesis protein CcmF